MLNKIPTHVRFSDFIRSKNMTNEDLGNLLVPKVSKQSVGKWCRGICSPTKLCWRLKIESLSGGKIKPSHWPD